jgi:alpha-beta hydrolase superfamily lysophospholipase
MIATVLGALKWGALVAVVVWSTGFLLDRIGPTEPLGLPSQAATVEIGDDLDAWLAARNAEVPDLRPAAAARVLWAGEAGAQTPLSIVYLHGFSASAEEIRPVPDRMAAALGANLYFARLAGHGQDSAAMGDVAVGDWIDDLAVAMTVGRRLGERVILLGVSTGGTLAVLAASEPALAQDLAGIAVMSPNFRMLGFGGRIVEWPYARVWGPWVAGAERGFEPQNDAQAAHWTTRYPTVAVAQLGALVRYARNLDFAAMTVPAIFLISTSDTVVDAQTSRRIAAAWGAPSRLVPVPMGPGDDPTGHVLAGDILSPSKTEPVTERLIAWARQL